MIDLDVLIVGGGAQGLWILNDLTKRDYRAVLLQHGELGEGQTCHSHALIHRGHYYDDVDMMIVLNAAAQFWEAFVDEKGIAKLNPKRALAGFGPGVAVERHKYFWNSAGLTFEDCTDCPDVLEGGKVRHLFETEEFSLDASEVVAGLARDIDNSIYPVDGETIAFRTDDSVVTAVEAQIDGQDVEFGPKFVVLAAGVGNRALLDNLGAGRNALAPHASVQAQRKNHMLVMRSHALPPMTAVFPIRGGLSGVFLCPRTDADTGETVWLASDHNSVPFQMPAEGATPLTAAPSEEWVKRVLVSLRATAPALFSDDVRNSLELSVYTGLTSERSFGAGKHMTDCFIDPFAFDNLLAIWPTKLTLTPFASNVALRFIRPKVPEPGGVWPTIDRPIKAAAPAVAAEMWCRAPFETTTEARTGWLSYDEFVEQWQVAGAL